MKSKIKIINNKCDGLYSFYCCGINYGYFCNQKSAENAAINMKHDDKLPIIISLGFIEHKKFITTIWV